VDNGGHDSRKSWKRPADQLCYRTGMERKGRLAHCHDLPKRQGGAAPMSAAVSGRAPLVIFTPHRWSIFVAVGEVVRNRQRRIFVRPAIAVALSATVILATLSIASAQDDRGTSRTHGAMPPATTDKPPKADDPGAIISLEKGIAAPYRPCINARGWVNGRLVCD
jgi:hypothetical protein